MAHLSNFVQNCTDGGESLENKGKFRPGSVKKFTWKAAFFRGKTVV